MRDLACFLLAFFVGPAIAVTGLYAVGAFIAWDWGWAATASYGARFFFCLFAGFAAVFGFVAGIHLADALDRHT